jgi:hypothetical protein
MLIDKVSEYYLPERENSRARKINAQLGTITTIL